MDGRIVATTTERDKRFMRDLAKEETVRFLAPGKVEFSGGEDRAVSALAGRLGLGGESFDVMAQTWLRPIVDEGLGATRNGIMRGRCAVKLLGLMISGKSPKKAREEAGITKAEEAAFRFVSPDFNKMYAAALAVAKEAMGDDVLDAAFELATAGDDVRDRDGNVVGRRRSEKMLDRLLVMAGDEFRKEKVQAGRGGGGASGANVRVELHFDRAGMPAAAVEAVDV